MCTKPDALRCEHLKASTKLQKAIKSCGGKQTQVCKTCFEE